jgi:hypothetical protein
VSDRKFLLNYRFDGQEYGLNVIAPMNKWQAMESYAEGPHTDVLLWNGVRVFPGWLDDDGWHDSRNVEYRDGPENPQPTQWMPFPPPPKAAEPNPKEIP